MTDAPVQLPTWSRQRWWLGIALVLALQVAFVFILERHSGAGGRKAAAVPVMHLREGLSLEAFGVSDPTVFVLPHRHGFSGEAWLNHLPDLDFQPADWTEPLRLLPFAPEPLGANFAEFITANTAPQYEAIATLQPARSVPSLYPVETAPVKSALRIEGPLARRRMLGTPLLRAWASADLLTSSVVQVLVDAPGRTISAVLLSPGSRLNQQVGADANALEIAKAAQFEPAAAGALTVGTLTFEWQSLPLPATNAPPEIP